MDHKKEDRSLFSLLVLNIRLHGRLSRWTMILAALLILATSSRFQYWNARPSDRSITSKPNYNQSATVLCPTQQFPRRTSQETKDHFLPLWEGAKQYVVEHQLSFLSGEDLAFHRDLLTQLEEEGIPGMIVECGVAKAGSSLTFAAMKHPQRCLHLFDTFEGIPPPTQKDGAQVHQRYADIQSSKQNCLQHKENCDKDYYGNMDNLLGFVQTQFHQAGFAPDQHSISFHKGLFDDTVWPGGPIAYAHLDGDWYVSTYHMLQRISPFLSWGGYFVLDDAYSWDGATKAYSDFFQIDWKALRKRDSPCWTTAQDGKTYRLSLEVRALAQAMKVAKVGTNGLESCIQSNPKN